MKKIAFLLAVFCMVVFSGCSSTSKPAGDKPAAKTNFPQKPIELVVPFAPGGANDVAARIVANAANKFMPNGESVVVTNKAGGGAVIGATDVYNAKPDGYKLLYLSATAGSIQPNFGETVYTHNSFQPVIRVLTYSQVLVVSKNSPLKTFQEWLDYVKKNPNKFTYGTQGVGSTGHLAMEEVASAAGLDLKHVPFSGASTAQTALLGGHIQGIFVAPTDLNLDALRPLGDIGSQKNPRINVPLIKDMGVNVSRDLYAGIVAPKGIPKEVLDVLVTVFKKAVEDPTVREQLQKAGLDPNYAGPEAFQKQITDDYEAYKVLFKKLKLGKANQ